MNVRPLSVISTETRLVRSSAPLPHAPVTDCAEPSSACSTSAFSPDVSAARGPAIAEDGSSATVSQPDPIVVTPGPAPRPGRLAPPRSTLVTFAPGGGVKLVSEAGGTPKRIEVYPMLIAGAVA